MSREILVVDDEPAILDLARMILEDAGFSVRTAKDGVEALKRVADEPPALILLDMVMPGISGVEVCRILKSRVSTEPIPVVMFTVLGSESDRSNAQAAQCDGYLLKPFTQEALLAEIEKHLKTLDSPKTSIS